MPNRAARNGGAASTLIVSELPRKAAQFAAEETAGMPELAWSEGASAASSAIGMVWAMKHKIVNKQFNSSRCVVCGDRNKFSLNTRFYDLENDEVVAVFHTEDWHQSYPGRVHGGLLAAVLDETIGRAIWVTAPDTWAVTVELELKFRKPVPTDAELKAVARVTRDTRRLFEGSGEILLPDGTVAVEARGKYFKMPVGEIASEDFLKNEWYRIEDDPELEDIDIRARDSESSQ